MLIFLVLMVPCTIAILCAGFTLSHRPILAVSFTFILLTLQGFCITSYSTYQHAREASACQSMWADEQSEDTVAILVSEGYRVSPEGYLSSPSCF